MKRIDLDRVWPYLFWGVITLAAVLGLIACIHTLVMRNERRKIIKTESPSMAKMEDNWWACTCTDGSTGKDIPCPQWFPTLAGPSKEFTGGCWRIRTDADQHRHTEHIPCPTDEKLSEYLPNGCYNFKGNNFTDIPCPAKKAAPKNGCQARKLGSDNFWLRYMPHGAAILYFTLEDCESDKTKTIPYYDGNIHSYDDGGSSPQKVVPLKPNGDISGNIKIVPVQCAEDAQGIYTLFDHQNIPIPFWTKEACEAELAKQEHLCVKDCA